MGILQTAIKFSGRPPLGMTIAEKIPTRTFKAVGPAFRAVTEGILERRTPVAVGADQPLLDVDFARELQQIGTTDAIERQAIDTALRGNIIETTPIEPPGKQWELPFEPAKFTGTLDLHPSWKENPEAGQRYGRQIVDALEAMADANGGLGREALSYVNNLEVRKGKYPRGLHSGGYRFAGEHFKPATIRVDVGDVGTVPDTHLGVAMHELQHGIDKIIRPRIFRGYAALPEGNFATPEYLVHPAEISAEAGRMQERLRSQANATGQFVLPPQTLRRLALINALNYANERVYAAWPTRHPWLQGVSEDSLRGNVFFPPSFTQGRLL